MAANVANLAERRGKAPSEQLAPAPVVDRYPTVIGQGLSLAYVSSAFRLCLGGYRQQYVDLLDELMEKDPHAYSVVSKRVLTVGGGRVKIEPPDGLEGADATQAEEAAGLAANGLAGIPNFAEACVLLAWATYYAVSAQEIVWRQDDAGHIMPTSLEFVHHRRLSYPDQWTWDVHIWDQGGMRGPGVVAPSAAGMFGIRIADHPGQFIVHAPKVRGDYPTREGIGRQIAYWMTIKNIATRLAPQYLERYAIPFPDFEFNTTGENADAPLQPRIATLDDIAGATTAAAALGVGALSNYVHADAVKVHLNAPTGTPSLTFAEWIQLCDSQMSKAALGGTLTTEVSSTGGNRAVASTQKQGEEKLYEFDAVMLAATLKRDLIDWIVKLNFPTLPTRLYPVVKVHVNADPDPMDVLNRASVAATAGIPVDADAIAAQTNLPVVPNTTKAPRRMIPIGPVDVGNQAEAVGLPKPEPIPAAVALPNQPTPSKEHDHARNDSDP